MITPLLRSLQYRPCAALGTMLHLWTYRRQQYVHAGHYSAFCPRSAFVYISHYCSQSTDGAHHTDSGRHSGAVESHKGVRITAPFLSLTCQALGGWALRPFLAKGGQQTIYVALSLVPESTIQLLITFTTWTTVSGKHERREHRHQAKGPTSDLLYRQL